MRKKNDMLLKSAFEEAFPDLLRFFFKDADLIFDMERGFEFLDKELTELFPELDKKGGNRFVDMLVKAFTIDGSEKWMLIHIEIQAQFDPNFSRRMFQYFYRIFDRYNVPITALSVFTGEKAQMCSPEFHYEVLGTTLRYNYNTYHIQDHTEQQLLDMDNRFSLIVLTVQKSLLTNKLSQRQLAEHRFNIAKAMVASKKYNSEQVKRFLLFLKTYIYIENPEINSIFDQQIELLTGQVKAMGIIETVQMLIREEAFEEGMEKSKKTFVTSLLLKTDFDTTKIAALVDVDEDYVQQLLAEIKKDP